MQPEIIVLIGLPGSGKSTWRDAFLASSDAEYVIVSSDEEIDRMAAEDGLTYNDVFDKYVGKATAIMKEKFRDAVNSGKNIIWDQTNMSRKKRRGILSQIPEGYRTLAVAFEIDEATLRERLDRREKEIGKSIPPHVMASMAKSYAPPSKDEGFDEVAIVRN